MSHPDQAHSGRSGVKTLAIRMEPDVHAQLSLLAQLKGSTITEEIRQAIEAHLASITAQPDLAARAESVLEEIEREATSRRAAIATLFSGQQPSAASRSRSGRKSGDEGPTTS